MDEIKNKIQKKNQESGTVGFNLNRGYHLEFTFDKADEARALCEDLAQYDIFAKLTTTVNNDAYRVYIKDSDSICNLLALTGANKSLLKLHDQIALRSVRNTSNRRANCDTANINKQIAVAARQIEAIRTLAGVKNLAADAVENLAIIPQELKAAAVARIENPEASYEELAQILGISKSAIVRQLRRLCGD